VKDVVGLGRHLWLVAGKGQFVYLDVLLRLYIVHPFILTKHAPTYPKQSRSCQMDERVATDNVSATYYKLVLSKTGLM
jgi:hypothetical protein